MLSPAVKVVTVLLLCTFYPVEPLRSSVDKKYQKGIDAYKGERWSECIKQLEEALHLYKLYKTIIGNCRLTCNSKQHDNDIKDNIEDLKVFNNYFSKMNCLKECQKIGFEDVNLEHDISDFTFHAMQTRKPYEYLHMCYFQMNMLPKAASSTYTYLVVNPEDETMTNNLLYYTEQPEVDANEITDLQSEKYIVHYKLGVEAYKNNNWMATISNMEEAITDYLSSENFCRVECERMPELEWSPEFIVTISNNIASLLHCRQACQDKLKLIGYNSGSAFLADVLNYLQISYYHSNKISLAAKMVASYLIIFPNDPDMLENKEIYSTLVTPVEFSERSDIVYYLRRDQNEKNLLNLFHRGDDDSVDSYATKQ